ncbi:AAA ATPase domain-containing protein [Pseudovibrio ascidiaceicola]|uniref:AAA ATPase domain-containing protein n=1 Tax=Pseudovibrio ascidiaceicola TaxID=285279 RepID=A0A1I4FN69_9HYPH|nr:ATP-binding protein [Pseudovibrio ascidiaceicola]SFL18750.1 AAA ATPase domain-containing protein [Pseudovibrio ascidiaceicola]
MTSSIKPTQLTRAGYEYQDLVCIEILINWYHDPERYRWIKVEGEVLKDKLEGLDDVIACRSDDRYELTQVKFTIDPSREDLALSLDWLLSKKKRGTSLVQKWSHDVVTIQERNELYSACLKTNRIPDDELLRSLENNRISFDKLPDNRRQELIAQIGDEQKVRHFFACFEFHHSLKTIEKYDDELKSNVVPDHTSNEGWYRFKEAVKKSALRKKFPSNDGAFYLSDLRRIFQTNITQPLSQEFEVPTGYIPPSAQFHAGIIEATSRVGCTVISGLPGTGKSTYLSYLTEILKGQGKFVVRHHYWLQTDNIIDRLNSENALKSLILQIKQYLPKTVAEQISLDDTNKVDEQFSKAITQTIDYLDRTEQKLIVVIDGLDHVYRERSNIDQLEHLYNRLHPFLNRISLLISTQPVRDEALPNKLVAEIKRDDWALIPNMDEDCVRTWLSVLFDNGEFSLANEDQDEIGSIAIELVRKTKGYPLYLIYALQQLIYIGRCISQYAVSQLEEVSSEDINNYYRSLWGRLSAGAKSILCLIAATDFAWPSKHHLSICYEDTLAFENAFAEIQHLIDFSKVGVQPYHNSLKAFVVKEKYFSSLDLSLRKKIDQWLEKDAPSYWQWGWHWINSASLGNALPLINGVTREWVLESFSSGYSLAHIDHIISKAEEYAFNDQNYPKLVDLRLIRIRLINGPEFQIQSYPSLLALALRHSSEDHVYVLKTENLRSASDAELVALSWAKKEEYPEIILSCYNEVMRRLRVYSKFSFDGQQDRIHDLINCCIEILSHAGEEHIDKFFKLLAPVDSKHHSDLFNNFLDHLISAGNFEVIFNLSEQTIPVHSKEKFNRSFVISCCLEGINLTHRPEAPKLKLDALGALYFSLVYGDVKFNNSIESSNLISHYDFFFWELSKFANSSCENVEKPVIVGRGKDAFLQSMNAAFSFLAKEVAIDLNRRKKVNPLSIYSYFDELKFPNRREIDHDVSMLWHTAQHVLNKISVDLYVIAHACNKSIELDIHQFNQVHNCKYWNAHAWLTCLSERSADSLVKSEVLEVLVTQLHNDLYQRRENTGYLANDALDLAKIANGLRLNSVVTKIMKTVGQYTLGYGERKDTTFHELYKAIEYCAEFEVGYHREWLSRVAPFTVGMFNFTEREIRHLPEKFINLIAQFMPEKLPAILEYHLREQDWGWVDSVISAYIKYFPLNAPADHSILYSLLNRSWLETLKEQSKNDTSLKSIYDAQLTFIGGHYLVPEEKNTPFDNDYVKLNYDHFPPDNLSELIDALTKEHRFLNHKQVEEWAKVWTNHGKGLDVIQAFRKAYIKGREKIWGLERCLPAVFDISHKLQGKNQALEWCINDINDNHHWSKWSGATSEEQIVKYARIYKNRWNDILAQTLEGVQNFSDENVWKVVPTSSLVLFLLNAGQKELAISVTNVMLSSLEQEISHLPLPILAWTDKSYSIENASYDILLEYFFWPDKQARLKSAKQIAMLLKTKRSFRERYIHKLSKLDLDIEICDFLSILTLSGDVGIEENEIREAIKSPSLLSEHYIAKIFGSDRFEYILQKTTSEDATPIEQIYKNGIPQIYVSLLEEYCGCEYKETLQSQLAIEWNEIKKQASIPTFNPHNFCSEKYNGIDNIGCSLSWRAEAGYLSAFLKTVEFALGEGIINNDQARELSLLTIPFEDSLGRLEPSQKPANWPIFSQFKTENGSIDVDAVLNSISPSMDNEFVLRASGPIKCDDEKLEADFEIALINCGTTLLDQAQIEELFHKDSTAHGAHVTKKIFFEHTGRWLTDLLGRGYFQPAFFIGVPPPTQDFKEDAVIYADAKGSEIAQWKYWLHQWFPARKSELGPNIGTQLKCRREIMHLIRENSSGNFALIAKLKIVDARWGKESDLGGCYYAFKLI